MRDCWSMPGIINDMTTQTIGEQDTLHATMPKRELRGLDWNASLLTLGGVKWDTQIPETEAVELVHRAIELGVNTFDTAAGYGGGQSERRLGLALKGHRDNVFICTKSYKRDYDGARKDIEQSLKSLQTDRIDLFYIHGIEDDQDTANALKPDGVLKAIEEFRDAGHIKHVGVSGHCFKHNHIKAMDAYPFEAILIPVGIFNEAYGYSYHKQIIPAARKKNLAVLGMKVMGAGRAKHTADITPYLRFSINQDIDSAVIGCDSLTQLEQLVRIIKAQPPALPNAEVEALFNEAKSVTQEWDPGEFDWVKHYV